jgi:glycerol-3-phosphate dehydrogenase
LVIGAGVVGAAVARDLSRLDIASGLVEAKGDPGEGASKGNSALMCSGWDTPAGTLEREMVKLGHARYIAEAPALGLPMERTGSTMIAWSDDQAEALARERDRALSEGFEVKWLGPRELRDLEPHLGPWARAGLRCDDELIVDPFSTVLAYVLAAMANGSIYRPGFEVSGLKRLGDVWEVQSAGGQKILARVVVNCAGLKGDAVDALAGYKDLVIKPRKGQFLVFDRSARHLVNSILEPAPSPAGRGVLVIPTVFGNVMLGPTAEDVPDESDRSVSRPTLEKLLEMGRAIVPALVERPIVKTFAGMRPASDKPEYRLIDRLDEGFLTVGGIRSTGLSASMGLGAHVAALVKAKLGAAEKTDIKSVRVPDLSRSRAKAWEGSADPEDRELVCLCETVTSGEIKRALASPLPPAAIGALKRRTRAGHGRCQGFYCEARLKALMDSVRRTP